jgi:hypothetical protein
MTASLEKPIVDAIDDDVQELDLNDPKFSAEEMVQYLVDGGFARRQAIMLV